MKTSKIFSAALIAAAVSAPSLAQSDSDTFVLHMMGERSWQVECAMDQDDGDNIALRERGRGISHYEEMALRDVVSGRCEYAAPDNGELWLTIDTRHTGFSCPFGAESDGYCQMRVEPGMRGAFDLRRMGDPASSRMAEN